MSNPTSQPRPALNDVIVVASGVVTTALALLAVHLLERMSGGDLAVMRWYALVFPAGALGVGMAACSGYGIASWITGRKVGGRLLMIVVLLQLVAFGMAQWVEFKSLDLVYENGRLVRPVEYVADISGTPAFVVHSGERVSFFGYLDITARSTEVKFSGLPVTLGPLGVAGYLFRLLEMCGFALGAFVVPAALRWRPYCEACRSYMRTRTIGAIPAAVPPRKIGKKDVDAQQQYEAEKRQALEAGMASAKALLEAAAKQDAAAIRAIIHRHAAEKEIAKLRPRIKVALISCPNCRRGAVSCSLISVSEGKIYSTQIGSQDVPAALTLSLG